MADCTAQLTYGRCEPVEVMELLRQAEKRGKGGTNETLSDLLPHGECFKVQHNQKIVGAYLLKTDGSELFILAAAGRAQFDLTAVISAIVCKQAAQFETVAFRTVRPGLVKKAVALGYSKTGDILRKRIRQ